MKSIRIIAASAATLLALTGIARAQQAAATEQEGAGLLGKRAVAATLGLTDLNHTGTDVYGTGLLVNLPINANVDVAGSYGYQWLESEGKANAQTLAVTGVGYLSEGAFKPFTSATLGYSWESNRLGGDDYGIWGLDAGIEYSINATSSIALSGGYSDAFERNIDGAWSGTLQYSYWFTKQVAGVAEVSLIEEGDVGYQIGVAFRF